MFNIDFNIDKVNKIITIDVEISPEFIFILFLIFCIVIITLLFLELHYFQ